MVKVNVFFCGCSLKTGSLILLWLSLTADIQIFLMALKILPNLDEEYDKLGADTTHKRLIRMNLSVLVISAFMGSIFVLIGLNGIRKNKAHCLEPVLYSYGFKMMHSTAFMWIAFSYPKLFLYTTEVDRNENYALIGALRCIFVLGIQAYSFIVVKSYQVSMIQKSCAARNNVIGAPASCDPYTYCNAA